MKLTQRINENEYESENENEYEGELFEYKKILRKFAVLLKILFPMETNFKNEKI